jgi:hypothetical protein
VPSPRPVCPRTPGRAIYRAAGPPRGAGARVDEDEDENENENEDEDENENEDERVDS